MVLTLWKRDALFKRGYTYQTRFFLEIVLLGPFLDIREPVFIKGLGYCDVSYTGRLN